MDKIATKMMANDISRLNFGSIVEANIRGNLPSKRGLRERHKMLTHHHKDKPLSSERHLVQNFVLRLCSTIFALNIGYSGPDCLVEALAAKLCRVQNEPEVHSSKQNNHN